MTSAPAVPSVPSYHSASLWSRFGSAIYEGLLLFGVYFIFSYLYLALTQQKDTPQELKSYVFQLYIFLVIGSYFLYFWCHGGQTLAMKTWQIRLVMTDGSSIKPARAALRYGLVYLQICSVFLLFGLEMLNRRAELLWWLSLVTFLLGSLWALFDRDRQFLHDRLLGTRLIKAG